MAANDLLEHDSETDTFELKPGMAEALADDFTLAIAGAVQAGYANHEKMVAAYRNGGGIPWGDNHPVLFGCTCRFFKPLYEGALLPNLPDTIRAKLDGGGKLCDIGCGEGVSALILGEAFPASTIVGIDYFEPSITAAQAKAQAKGITNVSFETGGGDTGGGEDGAYDIVTFYDCFHDMSVASAAAKNAFRLLKPGGEVMLIEPLSSEEDTVAAQLSMPTCGLYSCMSCHICLPCGMVDGGDAMGMVAPTAVHRKHFIAAGFSSLDSIASPINEMGFRMLIAEKKLAKS